MKITTQENRIKMETIRKDVLRQYNEFKLYCKDKGIEENNYTSLESFINDKTFICDGCGERHLFYENYYESINEEYLCEKCGQDILFVHDLTQYDDYPLIDREESFDGGAYEGTQWREGVKK